MSKKTIIVNLYAGPGAGKSTIMAGVFSELKFRGIDCEMTPEYAKEKVWEGSTKVLENQIYVFGKQLHMIRRLIGKVDVIISDSPILLSLIYAKNESRHFPSLVVDSHMRYPTIDIFLQREKVYNCNGRIHTEEEAHAADDQITTLLRTYQIDSTFIPGNRDAISKIADMAEKRIKDLNQGSF